MQIYDKRLDEIKPYENNPRHNDNAVDAVANSIKVYEIYGIYNNANGKIYIGQTRQGYRRRFTQHLCPTEHCPLLQKAVKKYGRKSFSCELIDFAYSQEEANEKEKMWIAALGSYKRENGYNLSLGGSIGNFNKETLAKMSRSKMGEKNSFYGKHHTENAKARMSAWRKENGGKLGEHSRAKRIKCVELNKVFECVRLAEKETKVNAHHIGQVANKKYGRKTAGGYDWEWA